VGLEELVAAVGLGASGRKQVGDVIRHRVPGVAPSANEHSGSAAAAARELEWMQLR
jgi:hypothetical protein